jgi:hypothetical protein
MKKLTIAWYQAHPEYVAEQNRIYDSKRPKHWSGPGDDDYYKTKIAAHKARAKKLNRMPAWSNEIEIEQIFRDAPDGVEIDHIYPLQGELVSGLHVPSNLQYLTTNENCKKNNYYKPRRSIIYRATISLE